MVVYGNPSTLEAMTQGHEFEAGMSDSGLNLVLGSTPRKRLFPTTLLSKVQKIFLK